MSFRLAAAAGCTTAVWLYAFPALAAGPAPVLVPAPTASLSAQPPVGAPGSRLPGRLPRGGVAARTRVTVELDARGVPKAVSAVQRLTIHGVGDYFFAIPAPVRDVLPGRGTQSEPGLRPGLVLWQGFSGGSRILAARLLLDPARVAAALPLRVRLSKTGSLVTLELVNATTLSVSSFTAVAAPGETRRYLGGLARFAGGGPAPDPYVEAKDVRTVQRTVAAPLRVSGALVFPAGRRVPLDLVLGPGRRRMRFAADSSGFPKLTLAVRLSPWKGERRARETFDEVMDSTLRVARTRQYEMFVASPDPAGSNRTTYVFHTVTARVAAIAPARRRGSGFPLGTVAVAVGLGALLAACVVAWAHA